MKSLRLFAGALLLIGAAASPALMAQCPTGQRLLQIQTPTGVVRVVPVPGSAGGFPSGIMIRPGFRYVMTAAGSIRVGVFGETGTPPDGWVPQGPAGNGFPDPDAPTFSLLFRVGATGPWQLLGSGQATAYLGASDAPGSQILFGTDFPYRTSADHVKGVTSFFTDEAERRGVLRDNALALIPRLKSA